MTPTPQELAVEQQQERQGVSGKSPVPDGERVVISGMSGLFPSSQHIKDLEDILYNKVNPLTSDRLRWSVTHPEAAQHVGTVPDLDRFDAQFFRVHYRLSNNMDPMSRKVLEQAYNAIYDAGVNPESLSGKKVGVFVGSCFSETEKASFYDAASRSGLGITGCCKAMFANRISYWLNAKGPSMSIDEACCSSTAALEQAYLAMSRGECEAAIVGGSYLCLHPQSTVHYGRIINQAVDGKTKSFDTNADGCVKSEAINVLFLQKAKDALRIYADLMHAKTEFVGLLKTETGPQYGYIRNPESTVNFLNKFYEEARVPPHAVEYVEAFGSASSEADKAELEAIDRVFCKGKEEPLLVGSIISNIGYGEAASGISAITKVLLGYRRGEIAANLHCESPRQDVAGIRDGRMRVVTEHEPIQRSYVAVNGMSVTGVNSHVLLHGHYKPKDTTRYKSNIPHLVTLSARQDSTVSKIFGYLKSHPIDPEELALLHNIHQFNITGHLGRGFIILQTDEEQKTVTLCEQAEYFDDARRPLWFVYSGMGSQWAGMGAQLMRIPIFAAAIERCRIALEPKGIDIVNIITSPEKTMFNNILHSFVGIAAIQIGLTDVLRELGLVPDGIIGHSVGELGCAYADGCLTAEEMILSAYSRGLVSLQTPFIRGSMAAIGLGYEQISKMCPPEIEVACHNGPESSTISGPADKMRELVAELTEKGIFAKEVPCSNIAYHSRYIADAGPGLLKYLKEVIKTPRERSKRWVSTSVPEDRWEESLAKYSSAEYHTNNLLNPVLFEETMKHIPSNAVLVEVAPHGLLQAILKRSLPSDCKNIALTRRAHPDNTYLLLEAVGKLYMEGYNPKVHILYPKVEMPVSTETPFLSNLIEWAHGEKWLLPVYRSAARRYGAACTYVMSLHDKEHEYLKGHIIRENTVFPFMASLVAVWDTLAMTLNVPKKQLSVEFRDVHLYAQPVMHSQSQLKLRVALQKGTGSFEVFDQDVKVATGTIFDSVKSDKKDEVQFKGSEEMELNSDDIYDLLRERDYMYSGEFRSLEGCDSALSAAALAWRDNWVTFLDGLLQLNMLRQPHRAVTLPTHIRRLAIDVEKHQNAEKIMSEDKVLYKAEVLEEHDFTRCGGVILENINYRNLSAISTRKMKMQSLKFVPNFQVDQQLSTSLQVFLQIITENINKDSIKVMGVTNNRSRSAVFEEIKNIGPNVNGVTIEYEECDLEDFSSAKNNGCSLKNADVVILRNLSIDDTMCQMLHFGLDRDSFIVNEEDNMYTGRVRPEALYKTLASHSNERTRLDLVRWRPKQLDTPTTAITVRANLDFAHLTATRASLPPRNRLLIIAPYPTPAGLKSLVQTWRKDVQRNHIHLVTVNTEEGNNFFLDDLPHVNLAFTVFDHGIWGGEYFVPVSDASTVCSNVTLQSAQVGDVNALQWVEATDAGDSGIPVTVHYAGISNTDVKKAIGKIPFNDEQENNYGMDFSGITKSGTRVMGLVRGGAASSVVRAQSQLLWPVPVHWSLEDAATVPLAYAHAFYCLAIKAKKALSPSTTVFVHGGAGAFGQAVLSIVLAHGCQVFTTVSDIRKKQFLLKLFPGLKAENVGNSRDHSFRDMVLNATKGKGCEIVLSSVKGDLKKSTLCCGGFDGVFLDVSQIHNQEEDFEFGMFHLTKERAYMTTDFSIIFDGVDAREINALQRMISEGIRLGYVRPLSRVTYAPHDAARAFRLLAASRHRGRVLLRMHEDTLMAIPRVFCSPHLCQLIVMNDESLGLQLVDRLVTRGAKKLLIHTKDHGKAKFQFKLRAWKKAGVQIKISSDSFNSEKDVMALINEAENMGAVQGIYVIANDDNVMVQELLLAKLDEVSRKVCQQLRRFVVINLGDTMAGKQTCQSRAQNKLPANFIALPELKNESGAGYAVDTVERALCGTDTLLVAQKANTQTSDLLQQLAALAEINLKENTPLTATLEELGIQDDKLLLVATFLRVHYNVEFSENEVPKLTLQTIQNLGTTEQSFEDVKGLATFFSYVDTDELKATTDFVNMPTIASGDVLREDEFDASQTYLCIVPGMEGHHERFRLLCERLKLPAIVLQPGLDRPNETVQETAKRYVEVLLNKTGLKNKFYLLGYETGIMVALEIAAILEDKGLTGTVYCLGCAPDELQSAVEEKLSDHKTEEHLQNAVVKHMYKLMVGDMDVNLDAAISGAATWAQKVELCVRTLLGRVPHSAQYARALLETALSRIQRARAHVPRVRALRSRLVLLRAAAARPQPPARALQHHSQLPVVVHQLNSPLAHAARDISCASIVNEYLDDELLQLFKEKNICEAYLLNPYSFITVN